MSPGIPAKRPEAIVAHVRLQEMLDAGLGPAFTADVREAWDAAYGLLAGVMIAAAREVQLAA
ncbi:hypothetical protein [Mesorhizobium sp.]|uniref:hypothetical protein n=1 Tax=Mesorhizobium sp. TaxID=1871066 RepID=UPI0025F8771E|nr:hypothetical protein [Mesorhizobium sp.]